MTYSEFKYSQGLCSSAAREAHRRFIKTNREKDFYEYAENARMAFKWKRVNCLIKELGIEDEEGAPLSTSEKKIDALWLKLALRKARRKQSEHPA